jgi:demethylmenaquinone methyltransferase/2-methoxy-6-polyprenyl-1,4-benzoquinol methylase
MAQKAHRNFPFKNVNVIDADALNLPFPNASFDMAISFSAFPHFSDQQRAIDETHRVLKPGGLFFIIHLESSLQIAEIHKKIGGVVEHDTIPPETKMRDMLNNSKFEDISVEDQPGFYLAKGKNVG